MTTAELIDDLVDAALHRNRLPPSATTDEITTAVGRVAVALSKVLERARQMGADPRWADHYARRLATYRVGLGEPVGWWRTECLAWLDSLERKEAA